MCMSINETDSLAMILIAASLCEARFSHCRSMNASQRRSYNVCVT